MVNSDNTTEVNYQLLSIQYHQSSNYKLNIFLSFNEPITNALLIVEPTEAYKNSKEANFIITSKYYNLRERKIYKFNPNIQLNYITAAKRNDQMETIYTRIGQASATASKAVIGTLFILNMPQALTII